MTLEFLLRFLSFMPQANALRAEFVELYEEAVQLLKLKDQPTAKEALADIQADNDEGYARLKAKLAAAAQR